MGLILHDYLCESCGNRFEALVDRAAAESTGCGCGGAAKRTISGCHFKTQWATAVSTAAADPCPPTSMDTTSLADPKADIKAFRDKRKRARWEEKRKAWTS